MTDLLFVKNPNRRRDCISGYMSSFPVSVALSAASAATFTLKHGGPGDGSIQLIDWMTAKSKCEALDQRLAVLDTEEKLAAVREQM